MRLPRPIEQPSARIAYDILCCFFPVLGHVDNYHDHDDLYDPFPGVYLYVSCRANYCQHHGENEIDHDQYLDWVARDAQEVNFGDQNCGQ